MPKVLNGISFKILFFKTILIETNVYPINCFAISFLSYGNLDFKINLYYCFNNKGVCVCVWVSLFFFYYSIVMVNVCVPRELLGETIEWLLPYQVLRIKSCISFLHFIFFRFPLVNTVKYPIIIYTIFEFKICFI